MLHTTLRRLNSATWSYFPLLRAHLFSFLPGLLLAVAGFAFGFGFDAFRARFAVGSALVLALALVFCADFCALELDCGSAFFVLRPAVAWALPVLALPLALLLFVFFVFFSFSFFAAPPLALLLALAAVVVSATWAFFAHDPTG